MTFHSARRFTTPLATAFLLLTAGAAIAVPPGIDRPEGATIATEPLFVKQARVSESSNDGFVLCYDTTFTFGTSGGTEMWGYTAPNGQVFAIMGTTTGVTIVNASTKQVVTTIPGPVSGCGSTRWREMKTYGTRLYCVSECTGTNQGMMIINLANLPTSATLIKSYTVAADPTSHCMSIDTVNGYAYLVKANYSGFRVVSLADPVNPVELPFVNTIDLHDITAIDDTVYTAEGNRNSFAIYDMANKLSPVLLTRVVIPGGGYVHNIWPSADRNYVATTEEIPAGRTLKIWDISNMSNVQLVGEYLGGHGIAHNAHYFNDLIYVSHYTYGISVIDPANPALPVEVGHYDSYSGTGSTYDGCWGVWPYNQAGFVFGSQLDGRMVIMNGLFIDTDNDTLTGGTVVANAGASVAVDISIANDYDVSEVIVPLNWSGAYNMTFDSFSVAGLRTSGWQVIKIAEDLPSRRSVWEITGNGAEIPAGSGPVARAYFRLPINATGDSNLVTFDPVFLTGAKVSNLCFEFTPALKSGIVRLPASSCCVGTTGNVDGVGNVDIADLTYLVDHLFISNPLLPCVDEGNIDGVGNVDIADLTFLVDHLFINNPPLPNCP